MIDIRRFLQKKLLTKYSFLGFRILNSWNSLLWAYSFLAFEYLITPFFGINTIQLIAGNLFSILVNLSILILSVNAFVRYTRVDALFKCFYIPLLVYFPITINKIFIAFFKILSLWFLCIIFILTTYEYGKR